MCIRILFRKEQQQRQCHVQLLADADIRHPCCVDTNEHNVKFLPRRFYWFRPSLTHKFPVIQYTDRSPLPQSTRLTRVR